MKELVPQPITNNIKVGISEVERRRLGIPDTCTGNSSRSNLIVRRRCYQTLANQIERGTVSSIVRRRLKTPVPQTFTVYGQNGGGIVKFRYPNL